MLHRKHSWGVMNFRVDFTAEPSVFRPTPRYRVSTNNLDVLDSVVKTASLYCAYASNPAVALSGAVFGAWARHACSSDSELQQSERRERIDLVSSTCLTVVMAAYAGCVLGPHLVAPFFLGYYGIKDGVIPLMYRAFN